MPLAGVPLPLVVALRVPTWLPLGLPVDVLADGLPLGEGVPALVLLSCDSVAQPYRAAATARTAKERRFIENLPVLF